MAEKSERVATVSAVLTVGCFIPGNLGSGPLLIWIGQAGTIGKMEAAYAGPGLNLA